MLVRGNKKKSVSIIFWLAVLSVYAYPQEHPYYLCTYEGPDSSGGVVLLKVDLDQKSVVSSLGLPMQGELAFRVPLVIDRARQRFYVVPTNDGLPAKNSQLLASPVCNYSVINNDMALVVQGQLSGISIIGSFHFPLSTSPLIKVIERQGDSSNVFRGRPVLVSGNRLEVVDRAYGPESDADYPEIGGFRYFKRVAPFNDRYYWAANSNGVYILVIGFHDSTLINSTLVCTSRAQANIFALSPGDSLIYCFFINYNSLGGPEAFRKTGIDPSYLITFAPESLAQIDSLSLPSPSLDYGYVQPETGICDKVGPYLVYYFFLQESYKYFSPAMLFIFDTRTNEATWLRVGWR